jgi:hypothetical protein
MTLTGTAAAEDESCAVFSKRPTVATAIGVDSLDIDHWSGAPIAAGYGPLSRHGTGMNGN